MAQSGHEVQSFKTLVTRADSAFKQKKYTLCGTTYEQAFAVGKPDFFNYFRAAKCFAMAEDADKSFAYLGKAVDLNWQYTCKLLQKDEKLDGLKSTDQWGQLLDRCKQLASSFNEALRQELLLMRNEYQVLSKAIPPKNHESFDAKSAALKAYNRKSTLRIKEIINQYGWPGNSLVGEVGAHAAWLLVQHADMDPVFQEKCLDLLEKAYRNGEASGQNYAFLYDRVMVNKGEKQLFGTQIYLNPKTNEYQFRPIEDEANLNKRRAEVGLQWSAEEYAGVLGFNYKPNLEKYQNQKEIYKAHIHKALKAVDKKNYEEAIIQYKNALELHGCIETQHLIDGATALAHSNEDLSGTFFLYLKMAVVKGWTDVASLKKSKHFKRYRSDSRWEMLEELAAAVRKD